MQVIGWTLQLDIHRESAGPSWVSLFLEERERQTDRQTETEIDRQTDRHRQTDRDTQTDRRTHRHTRRVCVK